jgi:hypothetical protein
MLMKIEGVIKNGQSTETGNIGHTWHRTQDKDKHNKNNNKIYVGHHYA